MTTFQCLSLQPSLLLTEEEIKCAYAASSKMENELEARNTLLSPVGRITAWMEALGIPQRKHAELPAVILPLFSEMSTTIGKVNALSQKQATAQSLLTQALLTKELIAQKTALDALGRELNAIESETLLTLSVIERTQDPEEVNRTLQALKFIAKWKADLNNAYGKLF